MKKPASTDGRAIIFMNHHVHEKKATEPMITIQHGSHRIYCNKARITGPVLVCTNLVERCEEVETHTVKAWLECDFDSIEVLE